MNKSSIYILNAYIPPASDELIYKSVQSSVDYVVGFLESGDDVIFVGDFNLPDVSWILSEDNTYLSGFNVSSNQNPDFLDSIYSDLQQVSCITNLHAKQ